MLDATVLLDALIIAAAALGILGAMLVAFRRPLAGHVVWCVSNPAAVLWAILAWEPALCAQFGVYAILAGIGAWCWSRKRPTGETLMWRLQETITRLTLELDEAVMRGIELNTQARYVMREAKVPDWVVNGSEPVEQCGIELTTAAAQARKFLKRAEKAKAELDVLKSDVASREVDARALVRLSAFLEERGARKRPSVVDSAILLVNNVEAQAENDKKRAAVLETDLANAKDREPRYRTVTDCGLPHGRAPL